MYSISLSHYLSLSLSLPLKRTDATKNIVHKLITSTPLYLHPNPGDLDIMVNDDPANLKIVCTFIYCMGLALY